MDVLGGVTGVMYSVGSGVLSTVVIFTWDEIVGMTTFDSNWYFVFFKVALLCYSLF